MYRSKRGRTNMKDTTIFEKESNLHESTDIGMYYCGKRVKSLNHTYGPRIRIRYMFVLVNDGEATFFHKNGDIKLKAHDLLVMCPGEKIHYKAHTPWSIQWVGMYGNTVEKYMKQLMIDGDNPVIHIEKHYEMEQLMEQMYQLVDTRFEYAKCEQLSLIYKFFALLFQNSGQKASVDVAESAKKIIDFNFDKDISVQNIAKSLFVNIAYLTRRFTEKYGISPKEFMLKKRMSYAKKLLTETNANIKAIANSVGYTDPLYFSRIFKDKEGVSPSYYRKQIR